MARSILHVDINNCYASIEAQLNPKLKGLPWLFVDLRQTGMGLSWQSRKRQNFRGQDG